MESKIISGSKCLLELDKWLAGKKTMVVCGKSAAFFSDYMQQLKKHEVVFFRDFEPNPKYESTIKGRDIFLSCKCDSILAIGGGSSIDVAKCIRLFSVLDNDYLRDNYVDPMIPFLVIPTTAGTGSEATRFAVVYKDGEKLSVNCLYSIPEVVLLDESLLKTLPDYQRKATCLDALSHAIESMWSVNSTEESRTYSLKALELFFKYKNEYLSNTETGNAKMLEASFYAGKAINISETTAGHAMCYKITTLKGIAHGHAAALVNQYLFPYMIEHIEDCIDVRGKDYLKNILRKIYQITGNLSDLIDEMELPRVLATDDEIDIMINSVNEGRLKNNPVKLGYEQIMYLYKCIFG